jgi:hypothetical protein
MIKAQWGDPNADATALYWRRLRVGGERWAGNHSVAANVYTDPKFRAKGDEDSTQLCYTNPELVQEVARAARVFFDEGQLIHNGLKASGDYFCVVPDDTVAWCQCERCTEVLDVSRQDTRGEGYFTNASDSYYLFSFVNEVAKEVRKTHPDKYISALAYWSYAYPPKGLKLEPNVSIAPCLHLCYAYDQHTYYQNDLAVYRAWQQESDRPMFLWSYFHHPMEAAELQGWKAFPVYMPHIISQEVKRYVRDGVKGVFLCGIGEQLDFYVYAQLAFDADANADTLIDEFFVGYFGAAAKPMRAFHDRIAEINRIEGVVGSTPEKSWGVLGTPVRMEELERYIEQAVSMAATPVEKRRVDTWRVGVWEYMKAGFDTYHAAKQQDGKPVKPESEVQLPPGIDVNQ